MTPDLALAGKALLGALAVLLISLLSQSRYFFIAGLVPLRRPPGIE